METATVDALETFIKNYRKKHVMMMMLDGRVLPVLEQEADDISGIRLIVIVGVIGLAAVASTSFDNNSHPSMINDVK
jgi:hypothetical protein